MKLNGKTAIITGGASGIGRAVAGKMSRRGVTVILADINGELAEQAAAEILSEGGKAEAAALNVTDPAAVKNLVDSVSDNHGRLDYIFNNAGVSLAAEIRDMSLDDWNLLIDVNLRGVIYGVHAAYPIMIEQGFGHIVNTSSIAGLAAFPISGGYATTKHAVVGLSTALRSEAADLGVKVSVVCPGFIDTPLKDSIKTIKINKSTGSDAMPFKLHSVEKCAQTIIDGVAANKGIIVVTPQAEMMWGLYRLSPEIYTQISRLIVKKSRTMREE